MLYQNNTEGYINKTVIEYYFNNVNVISFQKYLKYGEVMISGRPSCALNLREEIIFPKMKLKQTIVPQ